MIDKFKCSIFMSHKNLPFDVAGDGYLFNAPRPLFGDLAGMGDWHNGRFYAFIVDDVCRTGETILAYENRQHARFCRSYAFETQLVCGSGDVYRAICANRGQSNSSLFASVYDPLRHDVMITFCRGRDGRWLVSLYSDHERIDCGAIARCFGGGGHRGAAGFGAHELPFSI